MKRFLFASLVAFGALSLAAATGTSVFAFPATQAPASMPKLATDPIVQVHAFHCRPAWARRWGWHRHLRACRNWHNPRYQHGYQQRRYNQQWRYNQQRRRNEQPWRGQR